MRKHPLLAFVTAIITCSIPGTLTAATADTLTAASPTADQMTAKTVETISTTAAQRHRARLHHPHHLRLHVDSKGSASVRSTQQVHLVSLARTKLHRHRVALAETRARAHERASNTVRVRIRAAVVHPYAVLGGAWASLRTCESHNNYAENSGNGYFGAYQFSVASWQLVGGSGLPSAASPAAQDSAAKSLFTRQGWHAWPTCSWRVGLS